MVGSPGLFQWRGRVLRDPEATGDGGYRVVDHETGDVVYATGTPPPSITEAAVSSSQGRSIASAEE